MEDDDNIMARTVLLILVVELDTEKRMLPMVEMAGRRRRRSGDRMVSDRQPAAMAINIYYRLSTNG